MRYWRISVLFILALTLNLLTTTHSIGQLISDNTNELFYINISIDNGWHWLDIHAHNNTSLVVGWFIPLISRLFNVTPIFVCKYIIPTLFSITPVLVYLLYKRYLPEKRAFIGALFFVVLPPTYLEVTTIVKSSIAEPLAVGALLVMLSNYRYKIPIASLLTILTLWCHYTIGFMLLAWLAFALIYNSKRLLSSIPLITGSLFAWFYFSNAGQGVIKNALIWWQTAPNAGSDLVSELLLVQRINQISTLESIIASSSIYQIWIIRAIIYSIVVVLALGVSYIIWREKYKKLKEYTGLIIGCSVLILLALYVPYFTKGLYLTRWIQINSIILCLLYGYGSYLVPGKITYPLLGLLVLFSTVVL